MLVLQNCTDPLHILLGLSSETNATSSDCAYHIGNVKVEEDLDIQDVEQVNVKIEKGIGSEEEEGIGVKVEEGIYSEEEEEGEDVDTKQEEDADIKQEVSIDDTV
jgi:hypothetical protein